MHRMDTPTARPLLGNLKVYPAPSLFFNFFSREWINIFLKAYLIIRDIFLQLRSYIFSYLFFIFTNGINIITATPVEFLRAYECGQGIIQLQ